MLWWRPKARVSNVSELRWGIALFAAVGLGVVAADGFMSAYSVLARSPLFVSTARIGTDATSPAATSVTAAVATPGQENARTPRRLPERRLEAALALSDETISDLSRSSETDDEPAVTTPKGRSEHKKARRPAKTNSTPVYRTVCVRLCDGSYFPISFATVPSRFARDEAACSRRCGAPSRLYVYPTGGSPRR